MLPRGAPYADGFRRVRDPNQLLSWQDPSAPAELAIFACDISRLEPRAGLPPLSSCPGVAPRRQRHLCQCGSAADAQDRHRLREAMLAQRSGQRPEDDVVGSPGGDGVGDH